MLLLVLFLLLLILVNCNYNHESCCRCHDCHSSSCYSSTSVYRDSCDDYFLAAGARDVVVFAVMIRAVSASIAMAALTIIFFCDIHADMCLSCFLVFRRACVLGRRLAAPPANSFPCSEQLKNAMFTGNFPFLRLLKSLGCWKIISCLRHPRNTDKYVPLEKHTQKQSKAATT